jgi:nucleotide-binding universal stress UspA family protein
MNVIVVGVDGSAHSIAALRHALHEARAHDASIRAVHAWHIPTLTYGAQLALPDLADSLRGQARATLENALEEVAGEVDGINVQLIVRQGEPGHVLVTESQGARQLIVGSRGHGNIGELILGSVSHYCCRHAPCPVTVIPHTADRAES